MADASIFKFSSVLLAGAGVFMYVTSWSNPASAAELFGFRYPHPHLQRTAAVFYLVVAALNHYAAKHGEDKDNRLLKLVKVPSIFLS